MRYKVLEAQGMLPKRVLWFSWTPPSAEEIKKVAAKVFPGSGPYDIVVGIQLNTKRVIMESRHTYR